MFSVLTLVLIAERGRSVGHATTVGLWVQLPRRLHTYQVRSQKSSETGESLEKKNAFSALMGLLLKLQISVCKCRETGDNICMVRGSVAAGPPILRTRLFVVCVSLLQYDTLTLNYTRYFNCISMYCIK